MMKRRLVIDEEDLREAQSISEILRKEWHKKLVVLASEAVANMERIVHEWISRHPTLTARPTDLIMDGDDFVIAYNNFTDKYERLSIAEAFIPFPVGLPVGIVGSALGWPEQ